MAKVSNLIFSVKLSLELIAKGAGNFAGEQLVKL